MTAGTSVAHAGARDMSRRYVVAGFVLLVGFIGVSAWLLHGWLQRRFDLPFAFALYVAGMPGGMLGLPVVWAALRTRPGMDLEQRGRAAEASEPGRRRFRAWVIFLLRLMLLHQFVSLLLAAATGLPKDDDWSFVVVVATMLVTVVPDFLPSRAGALPETVEFDQAKRCEALRVGYLVLTVLGAIAMVAAVRLPWVAGQAWALVLLASVLAAQIRMATLPRWTTPEAGEAG